MLRFLLIACAVAVVPLHGHANPTEETKENDFLDEKSNTTRFCCQNKSNILVFGKDDFEKNKDFKILNKTNSDSFQLNGIKTKNIYDSKAVVLKSDVYFFSICYLHRDN